MVWNQSSAYSVNAGRADGTERITATMIRTSRAGIAVEKDMSASMYKIKLICVLDGRKHQK